MKKDFSRMPSVRFNRSKFDLSHGLKTSMSVGCLYPLDIQEVLPGDTFKTKMTMVSRVTSAFLKPVMDNLFMDIYHFFIPLRLIYDKAENVFGNASPSQYTSQNLNRFPSLKFNNDIGYTVYPGSIADYLGLPTQDISMFNETTEERDLEEDGLSVLPFRAFAKVYNEWFRNENIIDEVFVSTGETTSNEKLNNNAFSPNNYTGKLPKVAKKKDYFTSCLPSTQKGLAVDVPFLFDLPLKSGEMYDISSVRFGTQALGDYPDTVNPLVTDFGSNLSVDYTDEIPQDNISKINRTNLYVDASKSPGFTVNDMRFAFQLQKMLERDALYGTRYNEYLLGHFGVSNPDSRLQFTEYLGGGRIPLSIQQVAQTSQGTEESPLANLAGYSQSVGYSRYSKGFTEHGYILTVACIRQMHTYSQGVNKMWFRKQRNDFYDPLYANLGEQPVYYRELFAPNVPEGSLADKTVFGYNEAWAEYRYKPSGITGQMRPVNVYSLGETSLDIWHFGDAFESVPTLSKSFIEETPQFVDRTLAVPSSSQDQFIVDCWFNTDAIRVMPTYSVPGLIDHH